MMQGITLSIKRKGWLKSKELHMPVDFKRRPLPWYTYPAINFVGKRLRPDMKVFEFGSGNSTLWYAKMVGEVISVEHNKGFYNKMKPKITHLKNITYIHSSPKHFAYKIHEYSQKFDVIIIDGINRYACLRSATQKLKADGVIILDNTDRPYKPLIEKLTELKFKEIEFKGFGPIGSKEWETSIFYRENNCFGI